MFVINNITNEAQTIEKKSFSELGFKERKHLQEWIAKNTDILHERLLIIQKEFSGFDNTSERLDLLALDELGNLVIIENKLDDSGKDVTWQALKYVSYCAGLTKVDILEIYQKYLDTQGKGENAEKRISEFINQDEFIDIELNKGDQRIILISANFRKEVTSTVMWLLEHNVKIKCIKVTPFTIGDMILVDSEQIIPVKDTEDYLIKLANKKQDELSTIDKNQGRHKIRLQYWTKLLNYISEKTNLYSNISPSKDNWLNCGFGYGGLCYGLVITGTYARVELWINKGTQEESKKIFDNIREYKEKIETEFGAGLDWQRLDDGKGSRIAYYLYNVNVFKSDDWDKMVKFMCDNIIKLDKVLRDVLKVVMLK